MSLELSPNAITVLERRYLKKQDGKVSETPEDMFRRVAKNIASVENTVYGKEEGFVREMEERFYELMTSLDFLPNSPTLMNAGRELQQLAACFVLPVEDSMEGIFDAVKYAALIQKSGGGVGFAFSRLRPKGDEVSSTGGVASGPVSFMKVFNAATNAVKQGGRRRGANMGILRVDHPDILEFITSKHDDRELTNFNISVAATGAFMEAVKADAPFDLINPRTGTVVKTVRAREIFDTIVEGAWKNGDPGIIFIDRINRDNPTPQLGAIESTNPCVTGDIWVMTSDGPRQVRELVGRPFMAMVNGRPYATGKEGFFKTAIRPVVRLRTREGYSIRLTADHRVLRVVEQTRYSIAPAWAPVAELRPGDRILLHNHRSLAGWPGELTEGEGYLLGLLVSDGVLKQDSAVLSVWTRKQAVGSSPSPEASGAAAVMELALNYARSLPHHSDFRGWMPVRGREEFRLKLASLRTLAQRVGMTPGNKTITPTIERASSDGYRGFLRGLFDCDASVQGSHEKGISIRLAQSDLGLLCAVQRMLLRLGIASMIYTEPRPAGSHTLPDGKGGAREYNIRSQHELVISGDDLALFADRIDFGDGEKRAKLHSLLASYRRRMNRERFVATVLAIEDDGVEDVYDVQVPGICAFDANGIYAHNCGEQPLLPYEACNLGSVNLAHMVRQNGERKAQIDYPRLEETVRLAVRFLDDVIDASRYPLDLIQKMARGNRKIGLGVMGFADMLIKLGIPYDSEEAVEKAREVMDFIQRIAREASANLAQERGPFPNFEGSIYDVPGGPRLRNATTTTVAPTGTISIIAGCSSGVEPLFAVCYVRNVLDNDRLIEVNPLFEALAKERGFYSDELMKHIAEVGSVRGIPEIPEDIQDLFVTAHEISPEWHIRVQAAFQEFTDNAVSKTVNLKHDATQEDVRDILLLAYDLGCKGVTVYRDRSRSSQVLQVDSAGRGVGGGDRAAAGEHIAAGEHAAGPGTAGTGRPEMMPRPRPQVTYGRTEKVLTGCGNVYVTVNEDEEGLCEIFTSIGKSGGCAAAQSEAISRLVSMALRAGIKPQAIVKHLRGIRCPSPSWQKGQVVLSCPDAIGIVLEHYLSERGEGHGEAQAPDRGSHPAPGGKKVDSAFDGGPASSAHVSGDGQAPTGGARTYPGNPGPADDPDIPESGETWDMVTGACPECGGHMRHENGCATCVFCGYSKCS